MGALELQAQHGQVLDVDRQQEHAGAAFHQVSHAAIAALQFALIEGRDGLAQRDQRGIRGVRPALHAEVVLLGLRSVALQVVELAGPLEQRRVVGIQPEGAVGVAPACHETQQRGAVPGGSLEHRLLAGRVGQLDAGHEVADQTVAGGDVGPGANGLHQRL
ncbi:hypothetical protein LMG6866_04502 [Ralstonia mannitolilytica]|nr:hypothetical protein LMG6866_04502 [Ralstonia mannitolilytica]